MRIYFVYSDPVDHIFTYTWNANTRIGMIRNEFISWFTNIHIRCEKQLINFTLLINDNISAESTFKNYIPFEKKQSIIVACQIFDDLVQPHILKSVEQLGREKDPLLEPPKYQE